MYAPNHASARARFWDEIAAQLARPVEHWIVGGDFNMIEDVNDHIGGSTTTVHGRELAAWEHFLFKTRVNDVWYLVNFSRKNGFLNFSRSNIEQVTKVYMKDRVLHQMERILFRVLIYHVLIESILVISLLPYKE